MASAPMAHGQHQTRLPSSAAISLHCPVYGFGAVSFQEPYQDSKSCYVCGRVSLLHHARVAYTISISMQVS